MARAEAEAAAGVMGRTRGYLNNRWPRWFSPTHVDFDHDPLGPFPHTAPLMDDGSIVLVSTPGHSPGHLSVVVETEGEAFFLAGDASYTEALMRSGSVDGVSRDERAARTTLRQIKNYLDDTGAIYLPSHDPDSSARLAAAQPAPDVRGNTVRVAR